MMLFKDKLRWNKKIFKEGERNFFDIFSVQYLNVGGQTQTRFSIIFPFLSLILTGNQTETLNNWNEGSNKTEAKSWSILAFKSFIFYQFFFLFRSTIISIFLKKQAHVWRYWSISYREIKKRLDFINMNF